MNVFRVEEMYHHWGVAQHGRGVTQNNDKAQCNDILGRLEAEPSNNMISCINFVYVSMDIILFHQYTYSYIYF